MNDQDISTDLLSLAKRLILFHEDNEQLKSENARLREILRGMLELEPRSPAMDRKCDCEYCETIRDAQDILK